MIPGEDVLWLGMTTARRMTKVLCPEWDFHVERAESKAYAYWP